VVYGVAITFDLGFALLDHVTRRYGLNIATLGARDPNFRALENLEECGGVWIVQDAGGVERETTESFIRHIDLIGQGIRDVRTTDSMSPSPKSSLGQVFENEGTEIGSPCSVFYVRTAWPSGLFETGGVIVYRDEIAR